MCGTGIEPDRISTLGESIAGTSTVFFKNGHELMAHFLGIVKE
jgi:hypothetical protein